MAIGDPNSPGANWMADDRQQQRLAELKAKVGVVDAEVSTSGLIDILCR